MELFVITVIWVVVGLFGFLLLDAKERRNISYIRFLLFLAIVPIPIILYSVFAFLSIVFTGSFAGLNLKH